MEEEEEAPGGRFLPPSLVPSLHDPRQLVRATSNRRSFKSRASFRKTHPEPAMPQHREPGGLGLQALQQVAADRKLGGFVTLDIGKLEDKLLQEQQKAMEEEQEALMAQWASPTRSALAAQASGIMRSARQSTVNTHTHAMPRSRAMSQQASIAASSHNIATHSHPTHSRLGHVSPHHLTGHDSFEHSDDHSDDGLPSIHSPGQVNSIRDGLQHQDSVASMPSQAGSEATRPRVCRPDVITTTSTRLLELFTEGQQRLAEQAREQAEAEARARAAQLQLQQQAQPQGWRRLANQLAVASAPSQPPREEKRPSAASEEVLDPKQVMAKLKGAALAAQALCTIERAERLLQRLQENLGPLDSRPGTSPQDLKALQEQLKFLRQSSINLTEESSERQERHLQKMRSRRQAKVWSVGLAEGGMLRNVDQLVRAASKRHGVTAPKSLLMTFVGEMQQLDEYNLVVAARHRLELMSRYERLVDMAEERSAYTAEAQSRVGLMLAEHILQELQQIQKQSKASLPGTATAGGVTPRSATDKGTQALNSPRPGTGKEAVIDKGAGTGREKGTGIVTQMAKQAAAGLQGPQTTQGAQSTPASDIESASGPGTGADSLLSQAASPPGQAVQAGTGTAPAPAVVLQAGIGTTCEGPLRKSLSTVAEVPCLVEESSEVAGLLMGGGVVGAVAQQHQQGEMQGMDKLTELRNAYMPRIEVMLRNGEKVAVPQTPDGAKFSGAYGRMGDFRKRARHQRAALVQHNPTAFQEEVAEMAEAQYRALAERAHIRYTTQRATLHEPRLVEEFMKAVKYLQADRPYFLPPVVNKQTIRRPQKKQVLRKLQPDWVVDGSAFEARKRENEARDVYDTEKIKAQQFNLDWQRVAAKVRFRRLVARVDLGVRMDEQGLDNELAEVRLELSKYRDQLRSIFTFYGCQQHRMRSDDMLVITMNTWIQFCNDAGIVDNTQRGCTTQDLQTAFVLVNFEEDKETEDAHANDDDAMMRFEFYEGLVRAAFARFILTGASDDASNAVGMLMEDMVLPHMPPEALVDCNEFRRTRLYCKDMDEAVTEYLPLLHAIHRTYRARDRTKYFWIEHWAQLLDSCNLLGPHTGLQKTDAKLVFVWSQAVVTDELRRRKRALSLSPFDLIEALARVADMLSLPDEGQIEEFFQSYKQLQIEARRAQKVDVPRLSASGQDKEEIWTGYASRLQEYLRIVSKDMGAIRVRRQSMGLIAPRTRPLSFKFRLLMQYVLACMREQWGGRNMDDCARKMVKMAVVLSGGIELS